MKRKICYQGIELIVYSEHALPTRGQVENSKTHHRVTGQLVQDLRGLRFIPDEQKQFEALLD